VPRSCSVCRHDKTADIAKAIAAGGSNRTVSLQFEVTESAVQRHRVNCLRAPRRPKESRRDSEGEESAGSVRFDSAGGTIASPKDLLSRLQSLFRLGDLLEEAITRKDVDAVVKLARELRATAESYAKVAGWLAVDGASSTVNDYRKQTIQILGSIPEDDLRALIGREVDAAKTGDNDRLSVTSPSVDLPALPAPE
jgi:hypothetical protein